MASNIIACRKRSCRETFKTYEQRKRHEVKCSKSSESAAHIKFDKLDNGGFVCRNCMAVISQNNNLKRHEKSCRKGLKPLFICNVCNKQFQYKSKFERHKQVHKDKETRLIEMDIDADDSMDHYDYYDHPDEFGYDADVDADPDDPQVFIMLRDGSIVDFEQVGGDENDTVQHQREEDDVLDEREKSCENEMESNSEDSGQGDGGEGCSREISDTEPYTTVASHTEVSPEDGPEDAPDDPVDAALEETRRKRIQRKKSVLKDCLNNLSQGEKRDVIRKSLEKNDISLLIQSDTVFEAKLSAGVLNHFKKLQIKKKNKELFHLIDEMYEDVDDDFLHYIATKIGKSRNKFRFVNGYKMWKSNNFSETRGRKKLPLEYLQMITDTWLENTIPSVDCRNGRESISIRRSAYLQRFPKELSHQQPLLEKKKRNTTYYTSTRRIVTCTHQKVVDLIKEKYGVSLPIGTVWIYKPFYVVYPSEKEKQLCLCTLCLNKRLLFNCLRNKYPMIGDSLSGFLMGECDCPKHENGFWQLKCSAGSCSTCKVARKKYKEVVGLQEESSKIKFYQFEKTETPYKCKKTGKDKISKKMERSPDKHELPKDILALLLENADDYLLHRYQVQNDKFVWKYILGTVDDPIFHMDYSENLGPTPKFEPQPAHFSKRQFSLHCTVMHKENGNHKFVYHLSDDLAHDSVFTIAVIKDLIKRYAPDALVIRFKSDNCSTQYKCKYVFYQMRKLAVELQKTFILYYGVKGHGKGLVDAMSGFGVKTPLRTGIITHDFFSNSSILLQDYLMNLDFKGDRDYLHFEIFERKPKKEWDRLPINGCQKQHMFAYFPDGSVQFKENMCSCETCLDGNFVDCKIEKGVEKFTRNDYGSESETTSDSDGSGGSDGDESRDSESSTDEEIYEIRGNTIFEAVEVGSTIAIHSPKEESGEIFYLCQVLEKVESAVENLVDHNNKSRIISKDSPYLKCTYLEKVKEKNGQVFYKTVKGFSYVLPYQVFLPCVEISDDLTLDSAQHVDLLNMF